MLEDYSTLRTSKVIVCYRFFLKNLEGLGYISLCATRPFFTPQYNQEVQTDLTVRRRLGLTLFLGFRAA